MLALLKRKTEKRNRPLFVLTKVCSKSVGIGEEREEALLRQLLFGSDYRFFCYPGPDGFDLLLITLLVL
jgi:hypothetical protein